MKRKFFISIIFLPIFCFSQRTDTTKIRPINDLKNFLEQQKLIWNYNLEEEKQKQKEYIIFENEKIYKCINCQDTLEKIEGTKITHVLKIHYIGFDELEIKFDELKEKNKRLQKQVSDMMYLLMKQQQEIFKLKVNKK